MNSNRLNHDTEYVRPKTTITELVQNRKDILEILEGHEEVNGDELDELPHNTRLKYITYCDKEGKYLFRWGGSLRKVHEKYVVLAGRGNRTFAVQRFKQKGGKMVETRFYKTVTKYDKLMEEHNKLLRLYKGTVLQLHNTHTLNLHQRYREGRLPRTRSFDSYLKD